MTDTHEALTEEARTSRLVVHLGAMVRDGATIVEQSRYGAIVIRHMRANILPNLLLAIASIVLWVVLSGFMFLLAAVVAVLGVQRKLLAAASPRRMLVRVDELGKISECELETA